jgi:4-amino-4-deoxy-L-arabinose transferase-like glycosyltransferase
VHSILGLLLTWALARAFGLAPAWAVVASAIVAASPLYLFMSLQAMSDVPSMVWSTAAMLASWRSREHAGWAVPAGGALALAVLIRPANALAIAPAAVALSWPGGPRGIRLRRLLWFVLGGIPGAAFYLLHSRAAYGHFLTTGYGDVGSDFGLRWVGVTLVHYAFWLPILFTPVTVFVLALPRVARSAPCAAAVLMTWILAFAAFYATYSFTHRTWWYLRFLLPAVPALVVGGLLGLRSLLPRSFRRIPRYLSVAVALGAVVVAGSYWSEKLNAVDVAQQEDMYPRTANWLRLHLPASAVILCMQTSGVVYFETSFALLRWDHINAMSRPRVMAALKSSGRPLYAALYPFETEQALKQRMPGRWVQVAVIGNATVWRWDGE